MGMKPLAALVLASIAGGCIPAGGLGPIGPQYASGQQIFNTLSNFSVVGTMTNGGAYCEHHGPGGQIVGSGPSGYYQGTWAVAGNQICYTYPQLGVVNSCQNVTFQGQRATFYDSTGKTVSSGNLVGGNVC